MLRTFTMGLFFVLIYAVSFAGIINVPGDQPTIQQGIYAAAMNDTVLVADGVWAGDGNRDLQIMNTTIVVKSANGPNNCIIDCGGTSEQHRYGVSFGMGSVNNSIFDGFTVTNAYSYYGAIYAGDSTSPTIRNCIIDGNNCSGIYIQYAYLDALTHVENCVVTNNTEDGLRVIGRLVMTNTLAAYNGENGLNVIYHFGIDLYQCTFAFNTMSGFYLAGDPPKDGENSVKDIVDSALIRNCLSAYNGDYGIIKEFYLPATYFYCNDAYGNGDDNYWGGGTYAGDPFGNISEDPLFCDTANADFAIDASSPCASLNNSCGTLIGAYDVGCFNNVRTWHINADGTGDATTIQAAVDSASSRDTVLLADGVYTGEGNRDIVFGGKNIVLTSENGFAYSIVDCQGESFDPHIGFIINGGETTELTIDNISVINAYSSDSGAIYIHRAGATIKNCRIMYNETNGIKSELEWFDTVFVTNCEIANNTLNGITAWSIQLFVDSCEVYGNDLNGIQMLWSGGLSVKNSVIFYNGEYGVHGFTMFDNFEVVGNTIVGNDYGLVWWFNYPKNGEAKSPDAYAGFDVSRNIIAFNNNYGIHAEYDTNEQTDSITACNNVFGNLVGDFQGVTNYAGDAYGNISEDPLFCDTTEINWHISYDSPCYYVNNSCGVLIGALDAECDFLCGDVNNDDALNILDITQMIYCLYIQLECPLNESDINGDGNFNILDITYLVAYLYLGGPGPNCQ